MSQQNTIQLSPSWLNVIGAEFDKPYMQALKQFLQQEKQQGKIIFPPTKLWFNALNTTAFEDVKLVIIGQDPYHGLGQAHGLSFSVPEGVRVPPSLLNIYKELVDDVGITMPAHGNLTAWAEQGVLLLNATLTVEQANAGSHQNKGWETFTDAIITALNEQREQLVFLLWGSYAQKKGKIIDQYKHRVLQAPHPSPLSAHRGFLGCKHFSQANAYLINNGLKAIDWQP